MQSEIPVLVVGAGPVGLTAGILLSRQGVASRVLERRDGVQRAPAAHVVNGRSFEILRQAGLDVERLRALGQDPDDAGHVYWLTSLVGEELGRLPFEQQTDACLAYTPTPLRNLSQHTLEPELLESLRKSPGASIDYGWRWESAHQDADGVTSRVRELSSDTVHEVRSRFLLAADGAGSRVRRSLGIEPVGPARIQSFVMIHFGANLRPLLKDRRGVLFWICNPAHPGTFVAHDIDREWVYMHGFDPDRESADDYDAERCAAIVRGAAGVADLPLEIRSVSTWHMTAQVAERLGEGRIFLVGDAAHRFPPTGGLGLNSGLQDVHNLAWKLRAVLEGEAGPALLASYESERRPVAQDNADQSLRNAMRLVEVPRALGLLDDPTPARLEAALADPATRAAARAAIESQGEHFDMLGLQLGYAYESGALVPDGTPREDPPDRVRRYHASTRPGARLPHGWLVRDGERISTLDLVAPDAFTLLVGPAGDAWLAAAGEVQGVRLQAWQVGRDVADPDGSWAALPGVAADGALLVRPDQHVAWRAPHLVSEPAARLGEALDRVLDR